MSNPIRHSDITYLFNVGLLPLILDLLNPERRSFKASLAIYQEFWKKLEC